MAELVPLPPDAAALRTLPLEPEFWLRGRALYHIHELEHGASSFNPGKGKGRFHPIARLGGASIPTLYGGSTLVGALCETLFRLEPSAGYPGRAAVPKKRVLRHAYALIVPRRPLRLLRLGGDNLRQLALLRAQLLEPGPSHYGRTARWGEALHAAFADIDGLVWRSRQHDESDCVLFFGDRVRDGELGVDRQTSFETPAGWKMLLEAAARAGFVVAED
ncbi:hypothetical protein p2A263 (plasmid) [Aromatoleum aromaticum EbN1]|uniref:RES domain-containing protein n=1 Tax=Aromatoleum aromaticum (strain DSM 19018 / LMG 30748 / EbN1) TaxID=76114 RepID=Q5NWA8_AROAE|nr:RES family NAD+ phosphorylase [Aromatoleum aromaticum]CAI10656.1 hypothetical protein p2A263 [Aromatoleum aromaticum EbN1]